LKNQLEKLLLPRWSAFHMRYLSVRFLSSVTCAGLLLAAPNTFALSSETAETLRRPQPTEAQIPIVEQKIGTKTYLTARMIINAPAKIVWSLLTDYANAPAIFKSLRKSEVLSTRGNVKTVKQLVCPTSSPFKFDYIVDVEENEPTSITWHRTGGSMKEVTGRWDLLPIDDNRATLITYRVYLDGGFFLPAWLLRMQMKGSLPKMLLDVKQAAEHKR
jgi:uncharacterized membrane protein